MKLLAKDYIDRKDLEMAIKAEFGFDIIINREAGHIIEGKRKDLEKLNLDDTSEIHGVRCVITDSSTKKILKEKKEKYG